MKIPEEILEIAEYISKNYSEPLTVSGSGDLSDEVILASIKEFSQFDYDATHKYFTRDINGVMFATEVVELKEITNLFELHKAISYLQDAYEKRHVKQDKKQEFHLDEKLFTPPKEVQEISRNNVMNFLKKEYNIESERQLYETDNKQHKNIVYDIYRNFTGFVPLKNSPNRINFTFPEESNIGLSYSNVPDFENDTNLFSHLRTMRSVKKNTQELIKQTTPERLEQLKRLSEDKKKEQEIERENLER